MNPFDLWSVPLGQGSVLIEASAGTGKTFSLCGLAMRLAVEEGIALRRILMVSFSQAAADELRSRLRSAVLDALDHLEGRAAPDDAGELGLWLRRLGTERRQSARRALRQAVAEFDELAVGTIHGFCGWILTDYPMWCEGARSARLTEDALELIDAFADDEWRRHYYRAPALIVALAMEAQDKPDVWRNILRELEMRPELVVEGPSRYASEGEVLDAYEAVRAEWSAGPEAVLAALEQFGARSKATFRKTVDLKQVEPFFDETTRTVASVRAVRATGATQLATHLGPQKKGPVPDAEFFRAVDRLFAVSDQHLAGVRTRWAQEAAGRFTEERRARQTRVFGDLIGEVAGALRGPSGRQLREALRNRFDAVLIDEFQDTDALQAEIFTELFGAESERLFLIGDPKQSIYGFRGADVLAYLAAARRVAPSRCFTMRTNYRTEAPLLTGIERLFRAAERPFVLEEIAFREVDAAGRADEEPLRDPTGARASRLDVWSVAWTDAETTERQVFDATADEVVRLLSEGWTIGERPVRAHDVVILLRRNAEASTMQRLLRRRGVMSALQSTENVFSSREAAQLFYVVGALAQPGDETRLRTALVTDLCGWPLDALWDEQSDRRLSEARGQWLHRRELWMKHGFYAAFRRWMVEDRVVSGLSQFEDGERRLINLLHMGELLQEASIRLPSPNGLLDWYSRQLDAPDQIDRSKRELRLESDEASVRLVTVHRSKGLEFGIVFCPTMGGMLRQGKDAWVVSSESGRRVLDLGSDRLNERQLQASREIQADDARLLYVAVTRAKHRCVVTFVDRPQPKSALPSALKRIVDEGGAALEAGGPEVTVRPVPSTETMLQLPPERADEAEATARSARTFAGHIATQWGRTSFSGLIHSGEASDFGAVDVIEAMSTRTDEQEVDELEPGFEKFPTGTRAGACVHAILERFPFGEPSGSGVRNLVRQELTRFGFEPDAWQDALSERLEAVAQMPLPEVDRRFSLKDLQRGRWRTELEFTLRMGRLDPKGLAALLGRHGAGDLFSDWRARAERLRFAPVRGLLTGFIDMVFRAGDRWYVVDWKTNDLGRRLADYEADALGTHMAERWYLLQANLYAAALHALLTTRLHDYDPARHFGGTFFVFLRGVHRGGPRRGVWFQGFEPGQLDGLARGLREGS